jgi:hypothetical protein
MDDSKFHFYSFGIVGANKPRNTDMVEVFPQETFSMSAGEITDNVDKIDVKGKDAAGLDYQGQIQTKPTITCKWLPIGEPNRVTAPDVRRNEQVIIYRYADTEYYFWSTAFNNVIRKLETASWWFSGTPVDGDAADKTKTADNGYFMEWSTHDGHIIISTSNKNGEKARYTMQFDTKNGNWMLQDDLGNMIELDSVAGKLTATTENEIIHNTKKYTVNTTDYIVNTTNYTVNATAGAKYITPLMQTNTNFQVDGASLLKGFANFTTGIGGGGSGATDAPLTFKGNVSQIGSWSTKGIFGIIGDFSVQGTGSFSGNVSAPNI